MKKSALIVMALMLSFTAAHAGLSDAIKEFGNVQKETTKEKHKEKTDEQTTISGLREALSIGTENAVKSVSRVDGYFGNQVIRIPMPENLKTVAEVLSGIGFQKKVDSFVLSMNRAAEKAAPKAASIFIDAIKQMTFEDATRIHRGGETAATEFFRQKTYDRLYASFKPEVSSSMNKVGCTRSYKDMIKKYESVPFVDKQSLDLDHYVTGKALEGLFYMVGEEEKKIRKDPAARVTDILKTVFGSL